MRVEIRKNSGEPGAALILPPSSSTRPYSVANAGPGGRPSSPGLPSFANFVQYCRTV
jgi:hypothetical protein